VVLENRPPATRRPGQAATQRGDARWSDRRRTTHVAHCRLRPGVLKSHRRGSRKTDGSTICERWSLQDRAWTVQGTLGAGLMSPDLGCSGIVVAWRLRAPQAPNYMVLGGPQPWRKLGRRYVQGRRQGYSLVFKWIPMICSTQRKRAMILAK
jgi:hypothetical protein